MQSTDAIRWQAGWHVVGTSLWCDALRPRGACFVSSLTPLLGDRRRARQLVVSSEVGAAIGKLALLAPDALLPVRPYRPFSLGRARVELLETGRPCESALLVEIDRRRILYVDALPDSRVTLRDADVLAVGRPLVAHPVKQLDEMVKQIDQRLEAGGCEVIVRDVAWLPILARWPVRLAPQVAALAALVAPSLVSDPTARLVVTLRGSREALVLDRLAADRDALPALIAAVGAQTVFTTTAVTAPPGVLARLCARPTQLGLWRDSAPSG